MIRRPAPSPGQPRPEKRFTYQQLAAPIGSVPIWKLIATSGCASGSAPACVGTAAETRTEITYGSANLLPTQITVKAGDSSVTTTSNFDYDRVGNLASVTDGRGNTTQMFYNAARQMTGRVGPDPDGTGPLNRPALDIAYAPDGQVSTQTEGMVDSSWAFTTHRQLQIAYDAYHRKVAEKVVAAGSAYSLTQFGYDADGRAECVAVRMNPTTFNSAQPTACTQGTAGDYGPDRITQTYYDSAGRVGRQASAVGTADVSDDVQVSYTPNGLPQYLTDGMGNVTLNIYDGFDRLSMRQYPAAPQGAGASNGYDHEEFGYDANDNLTITRLRDGRVINFGYDALNRRLHKSPQGVRGVAYDYDLLGHLTQAAYDYLGSVDAVTMSYNALGQKYSESSKMGGVTRTVLSAYDAAGNRWRIHHNDGVHFDWSFDALNRPKNAWWWAPGSGTVPFVAITYDQQARRSDINRASSYTGYAYDAVSRLGGMNQRFAGGAGDVSVSMSHNPAGQIVSQTKYNDDYTFKDHYTVDRSYTTNGLNQYTASGSTALGYDVNGNLTTSGSTTYAYDPENRLVSSSTGVTLTYDPLGRLWQTSSSALGKTRFVYDGEHVVAEYDGDTGGMRRRYMWGPGADEPILIDEGSSMNCSTTRFAHTDERGSVVALADCWGNRTKVQNYDEYGIPDPANAGVSAGGRFGYTGQMWIPELGLWYYKARIYSPTLGRFMQTDPVGYADGMNWYNYVGSDPVNRTDPSGLSSPQQCDQQVGTGSCLSLPFGVNINGPFFEVTVTARRLSFDTANATQSFSSPTPPPQGGAAPAPAPAPAPQSVVPEFAGDITVTVNAAKKSQTILRGACSDCALLGLFPATRVLRALGWLRAPNVRGLPPENVLPPTDGPFVEAPASRTGDTG